MAVAIRFPVENEAPVCRADVVVASAYHLKTGVPVIPVAVAVSVVPVPLHIVAPLTVIMEAVESGVTVTVTARRPVVLASPSQ